MEKGRFVDALRLKKCFRIDWKGGKMSGRRWKCWQEEADFEREFEG